jgi:serine protease Do
LGTARKIIKELTETSLENLSVLNAELKNMNPFTLLSSSFTTATTELVAHVMPSLVIVQNQHWGAGAGMIWNKDGLILTNNHVVGRHPPRVILPDDRKFESRLIARDPDVDLALLEIAATDLIPAQPASRLPRPGEMAFAFGHPWGQRNMVTAGIISALTTAQTRSNRTIPIVRTDVPLAPGNSGGPLVNAAGDVIGINTMIVGGDQSLSIGVSVALEFIASALSKRDDEKSTRQVTREVL